MDADPYLKSAGIASDWPYGRGCWQSKDKQCIIWFGEEDQLRIMCMKKGTRLDEVFNRLKKMLDTVESIEGIEFAKSDKYGYITSCPSNLGTGMRASVHIKVPKLTADGQSDPHGNSPTCNAICKPLGLSVRGTGGEHTPIGSDGTIDLSPSSRLFIKEKDIIHLREVGFTDGEILEINQVASYFNYVNRSVVGLGVDTKGDIIGLSPNKSDDPDKWNHD